MRVIVMDAEVELIPPSIRNHPQIKAYSRMFGRPPSELLLDQSYCYAAMKELPENDRRGRPDILHRLLLTATDSPKDPEVFFHTRGGMSFKVEKGTRLPRNYNRFSMMLVHLLLGRKNPLITPHEPPLENAVILDPSGKYKPPSFWHGFDGTVVVGGFPKGTFKTELEGRKVSVWPEELTAPAALSLVLAWSLEEKD